VPLAPRAEFTGAHVNPLMHSLSARQRIQVVSDPRGVDVHVFVAGLQLLAPQSVASVATVQARQVPATQRGEPPMCEQSPSPMQAAQAWAPTLQRLALTLVQSVLASHCTQALPKQAGVPPLQSLRFSHWTHALPTHAGVPPLQSLRFSHCTQLFATQAGVGAPQSARSSQRTQVLVGRHAASGAVQSVPTVQATQVCVSRSHAGPPAAPTQSAFDAHSTHVSMKHAGVLDGQREHGPASLPASGAHASSGVHASGTSSNASSPGASRFASGRRNASGGPASIAGPAASMSMQRPSISSVPEGHSAEPHPATASRAMRRRRTSLT
jgi:hypothetical protein